MNISSAEVESDSELDDYLILRFVNFAFFVDFEAKFREKKVQKVYEIIFYGPPRLRQKFTNPLFSVCIFLRLRTLQKSMTDENIMTYFTSQTHL